MEKHLPDTQSRSQTQLTKKFEESCTRTAPRLGRTPLSKNSSPRGRWQGKGALPLKLQSCDAEHYILGWNCCTEPLVARTGSMVHESSNTVRKPVMPLRGTNAVHRKHWCAQTSRLQVLWNSNTSKSNCSRTAPGSCWWEPSAHSTGDASPAPSRNRETRTFLGANKTPG